MKRVFETFKTTNRLSSNAAFVDLKPPQIFNFADRRTLATL